VQGDGLVGTGDGMFPISLSESMFPPHTSRGTKAMPPVDTHLMHSRPSTCNHSLTTARRAFTAR
jgi:hypothetical protein